MFMKLKTQATQIAAAVAEAFPDAPANLQQGEQPPGEWRRIYTKGHARLARHNKLTAFGAVVLVLFGASLAHDIYGSTVGAQKALEDVRKNSQPAGWFERFWTSPFKTISGSFKNVTTNESAPPPAMNFPELQKVRWQSSVSLTQEDVANGVVTKSSEMPAFVKAELDSLAKSGKPSSTIPCADLVDIQASWANEGGKFDAPRCKVSDDTVWMVSAVALDRDGRINGVQPWIGVFKRLDGQWQYRNVRFPTFGTYAVDGYETVALAKIPYQVQKDFPVLTKVPEPKLETKKP